MKRVLCVLLVVMLLVPQMCIFAETSYTSLLDAVKADESVDMSLIDEGKIIYAEILNNIDRIKDGEDNIKISSKLSSLASSDDMNEAWSQAVADQQAALEAQKAEQESFMAELDAANKAAEDAKAAAEKAAKEAADKVAKAAEKAAKEAKEAAEKAEKAAKEAAEKAAKEAAEKAAQDAEESKKAAEESSEVISIPASAGSETKTTPSTSDAEIVIELYTVDGVTYEFAAGVLYAVTDEIHQSFVPGRSCELRDVLIDSVGVLTGVTILWLLRRKQMQAKS